MGDEAHLLLPGALGRRVVAHQVVEQRTILLQQLGKKPQHQARAAGETVGAPRHAIAASGPAQLGVDEDAIHLPVQPAVAAKTFGAHRVRPALLEAELEGGGAVDRSYGTVAV
jgi:hypothetical protein